MSYKVDYQSGGVETSPTIPGKTSIDLPQGVVNATATSLTLTGKGVPNYGEIQQENFIRLLENFASKTAPANPTVGQIWYDTVAASIKVFGIDAKWHRLSGVEPAGTAPAAPQVGDLWFDTAANSLKVWDGSAWKAVAGAAPSGSTAPSSPQQGQFWYNTTNNTVNVWNGSAWTPVGGGVESGTTPPADAPLGTLWFSTTEQILYVKVSTSPAPADTPLYYTSWAQVWPSITRYASYNEYNELATRINRVVGAPSVNGANADVADNQWGWGQTDTLPIFTSMNAPAAFDNNSWTILVSRLKKALRHTIAGDVPVSVGFIHDGRGANSTASTYTPSVTWNAGWAGFGIAGISTNWTALQNAVTALESNRFSPDVATLNVSNLRTDQTVGTTWASTRVLDLTFTFASHNAARAFFNSAGSARFTISVPAGTGVGHEWYQMLTNNGLAGSGLVLDYKGTKVGFAGTYGTQGTTAVGFHDLDTSFKTIASYTRGGAYGSGGLVVTASYNSATAILTVRLSFNEDYAAGQSVNKATVVTDMRTSLATISGTPYLDSPAIAAPSVTASGTFTTAAAGT